ncbi:MAG: hypothetical protein JXR31_14905 [Prolixibacteraceae bacterium]|nr:hypothetical protein [Prolixibacteraceae bacterium]
MKKQILLTVFLFLAGVIVASASNIDGKWKGTVPGMDGSEMELTYTFKVDGEKLTGTIASDMGEIEISEGKVNGDEFEYKLDIQGMVMTTKGKVNGDEITLKTSSDWGDMESVIKRVKE